MWSSILVRNSTVFKLIYIKYADEDRNINILLMKIECKSKYTGEDQSLRIESFAKKVCMGTFCTKKIVYKQKSYWYKNLDFKNCNL